MTDTLIDQLKYKCISKYVLQTEKKSRTLKECCEGYKIIHGDAETDASCLPFCEKCVVGVCVAPNECRCNPGYYGDDCAHGEFEMKSTVIRRFSHH